MREQLYTFTSYPITLPFIGPISRKKFYVIGKDNAGNQYILGAFRLERNAELHKQTVQQDINEGYDIKLWADAFGIFCKHCSM